MCPAAHHTLQIAPFSVPHRKYTGALLPDGARQVENAAVKLLLNL